MSRWRSALQRRGMKPPVFAILALLCSPVCCARSATPQAAAISNNPSVAIGVYDRASFSAELGRLDKALQGKPSAANLGELRRSLPATWSVSTPEHTYRISTNPLRDKLSSSAAIKAETWLEQLQVEVEAPGWKTTNSETARAELNKILTGPGFQGVRPPSALDLLRGRVAAWVGRMLMKLFGNISRHPIGAEILFWLLLLGGATFIALWLFRYVSAQDSMNAFRPASSIVTSRSWQEWMRAARQASARGDLREAVHSAYWAGITRLEETGALPRDRTKTPREYLRLLHVAGADTSGPRANYNEPLAKLTSRLERIWYANRVADSEDFNDSLRQLEALGCLLE
jgi:uncharacterized protein DUF4129